MKKESVKVRRVVFGVWVSGLLCVIAAELQSVSVSSVSGSDPEPEPEETALQSAPVQSAPLQPLSRLQMLEKKAAERDLYLARMRELQKKLDLLTGRSDQLLMDGTDPEFGRLSKLKEKATLADQLARQVETIRRDNDLLVQQRDGLREELDSLKETAETFEAREAKWESEKESLLEKNKGLKETINRLLLGEFEYYEVSNGETLQSIAASPLVYGDASRAGWLRQANEGRVRNLDRLRDGDMLVVPRFPRTGAYEF